MANMKSRFNDDVENYFLLAQSEYNWFQNGKLVFQVFKGQYFRWLKQITSSSSCSGCNGASSSYYILIGYAACLDSFKDAKGNLMNPEIPSEVFVETYDNSDDSGNVCQSWRHELNGINHDTFTPPHEREKKGYINQ